MAILFTRPIQAMFFTKVYNLLNQHLLLEITICDNLAWHRLLSFLLPVLPHFLSYISFMLDACVLNVCYLLAVAIKLEFLN
jgi:hypothetical protein